jgi:hypothetical protein
MIVATFSEQPVMHHVMNIKLIEQGITVLGDRRRKHNNFVKLSDSLHEGIYPGPFDYIDIVILSLDLDWYREVSLVEDFETRVDQSFVKIKNKALSAFQVCLDGR